MADKLHLEIITPGRVLTISDEVDSFETTGVSGEFQIYPDHTPFLTALRIGHVIYQIEGEMNFISISGGFCEIRNNKAVILARTAEKADEIDVHRAEESRKRALKRLESDDPEINRERAEMSLKRADNRLRIAGILQGL